jgi:hypothetical protein
VRRSNLKVTFHLRHSFDFRFSRANLLRPSVLALIAANLFPLAGVAFLHWEIFPLLLFFWLENLVIGFYTVIRMLLIPGSSASPAQKISLIPFFCLHYGIFTLVHGVFIFAVFGGLFDNASPASSAAWAGSLFTQVGWGGAILFLSHGVSLWRNYIGEGEYKRATLNQVMGQPYSRVIILHLTIIFGSFLVMRLGSPLAGLALLVVLKTALDLRSHLREHEGNTAREPQKG